MNFITVKTFEMIPEAHIAMGLLEISGIECRLQDEHLIQTDWLLNIPVGGIKLQVPDYKVADAVEILEADHSGNFDDLEEE